MHYASFHAYLPEVAEIETRNITLGSGYSGNLPYGDYDLLEFYCIDPECDCRRVIFQVVSEQMMQVLVVVNFGWESRKFYEKWLGDKDKNVINGLKGPSLNTASLQSPYAYELLNIIRDVVLKDKDYVDRLKRHYGMFKDKIKTQGDYNRS